MKRKSFMLLAFFIIGWNYVSAQQDKKKEKEKPSAQKEMEEMMKDAKKMSAADKRKMDSMGIKMPSIKNVPKVSDKELADA